MRHSLAFCIVLLTSSLFAVELPDPAKVEHPGGSAAPASSPKTYADGAGFAERRKVLIEGLAQNDLQNWRKGYFASGGDAGKYIHGPIMAKLLLDPKAEDAVKMLNEKRSCQEQYHFACVNWSRTLPLFGEVLTDESKAALDQSAGKSNMFNPPGTENHKIMWLTSANVLPWYTKSGRNSNMGRENILKAAKEKLARYVKGLYAAGQGEWDSSTYLMFDLNGMLNIYDFSKDEECRLLAKAALDWYAAAYALKWTDGVYCGPNQRGYASRFAGTIADQSGWMWWGGSQKLTAEQTKRFFYAMHAATSSWRPNAVLCNIAHRNVTPLPFEQRNSKPNYWWGLNQEPKASTSQETLYVTNHYTLGSNWTGHDVQMSRLQLACRAEDGPQVFTGSHPVSYWVDNKEVGPRKTLTFGDGGGWFDRSCQVGGAVINMCNIPEGDPAEYAFFTAPESAKPAQAGKWTVMQAGNTYLAVHPLNDISEMGRSPEDRRGNSQPIVKFPGRKTGFILQVADVDAYPTRAAFTAALAEKAKVDTSKFAALMEVAYRTLAGQAIVMKYGEAGGPEVTIDGQKVDLANWPVYSGQIVNQKGGILSVTDGDDGFIVDFSGEKPVYRAMIH